jgi:hypothetical protein
MASIVRPLSRLVIQRAISKNGTGAALLLWVIAGLLPSIIFLASLDCRSKLRPVAANGFAAMYLMYFWICSSRFRVTKRPLVSDKKDGRGAAPAEGRGYGFSIPRSAESMQCRTHAVLSAVRLVQLFVPTSTRFVAPLLDLVRLRVWRVFGSPILRA